MLEAARAQGQKAVFYTSADPIARTNGVCLLGLYLVLQVRSTLALAVACGHPAVAGLQVETKRLELRNDRKWGPKRN